MIYVECRECHRWWPQPCEDCARDKADRHARDTGHTDLHILDNIDPEPIELTETATREPVWPKWMTRGTA